MNYISDVMKKIPVYYFSGVSTYKLGEKNFREYIEGRLPVTIRPRKGKAFYRRLKEEKIVPGVDGLYVAPDVLWNGLLELPDVYNYAEFSVYDSYWNLYALIAVILKNRLDGNDEDADVLTMGVNLTVPLTSTYNVRLSTGVDLCRAMLALEVIEEVFDEEEWRRALEWVKERISDSYLKLVPPSVRGGFVERLVASVDTIPADRLPEFMLDRNDLKKIIAYKSEENEELESYR